MILTSSNSNEYVQELASKLLQSLNEEIMKLPEDQRWLIKGRVINLISQDHYKYEVEDL